MVMIITIVQSYSEKHHDFVAVCILWVCSTSNCQWQQTSDIFSGIAWYYGDNDFIMHTNLRFHCTFRCSMCDLQYLMRILVSLVVKTIPLFVLSHCTMGQVGLSMGVHCPTWGPPYPTVRPIPLYHGTGGAVHGSPLSYVSAPISQTVHPIPLYHGLDRTAHENPLSYLSHISSIPVPVKSKV